MKPEVLGEISLGEKNRRKFVGPEQVWVGDFPILSNGLVRRALPLPGMPHDLMAEQILAGGGDVDAEIARLEASGQYKSVIMIPSFTPEGDIRLDYAGIVVRPKQPQQAP